MTDSQQAPISGDFAFLEQALWKQFRSAGDSESFVRAWLALQCRFVDDTATGVVVLGEPDIGPFAPVAFWPEEDAQRELLSVVAERAMAERQGVVICQSEDKGLLSSVAHPLIFDDQMHGVVAVALRGGKGKLRSVMRQLQWGAAWLELQLYRQQSETNAEQLERTAVAFDMLAAVLETDRFRNACNAVVTELALRLDCDPVSIGFLEGKRTEVQAISYAAQFGQKMNLIKAIGHAMDEAMDQQAVVLYPSRDDWEYRVTRAHEELAAIHRAGSILTIPLHSAGRVFGAVTFERPSGKVFDELTVELCDGVASIIGPVLEEKKRNDRWIGSKVSESISTQIKRLFGAHYFGRKLAAAILLGLVILFSLVETGYRVTAPAILEGKVQRTIVAPFDGYLASQHARAGDIIHAGQLLATLEDKDLQLERLRWDTVRRQHLTEYDKAMAEHNRTEANARRAQIDEADAQVALLDEQLSRTQIKAPFDGILVSGDLTQSIGATVARGHELFELAPLNAYRVILEVDERDIAEIQLGQTGVLRITSMPEHPLDYTVERITPVAEQSEGRNFYQVESRLHDASEHLRPGMEGVSNVYRRAIADQRMDREAHRLVPFGVVAVDSLKSGE